MPDAIPTLAPPSTGLSWQRRPGQRWCRPAQPQSCSSPRTNSITADIGSRPTRHVRLAPPPDPKGQTKSQRPQASSCLLSRRVTPRWVRCTRRPDVTISAMETNSVSESLHYSDDPKASLGPLARSARTQRWKSHAGQGGGGDEPVRRQGAEDLAVQAGRAGTPGRPARRPGSRTVTHMSPRRSRHRPQRCTRVRVSRQAGR
jgi:hypothetical protein